MYIRRCAALAMRAGFRKLPEVEDEEMQTVGPFMVYGTETHIQDYDGVTQRLRWYVLSQVEWGSNLHVFIPLMLLLFR